MDKFKLAIILLLFSFTLQASAIPFSFFELDHLFNEEDKSNGINQEWNEKRIKISGFLYQLPDQQEMILAAQPNLKSCCIGSKNKVGQQIFVKNTNLPSTQFAVTVEGTLKIKPSYDAKGGLTRLYTLEDVSLVSTGSFSSIIWLLFSCLLIFIGVKSINKRKQINKHQSSGN